MIFIVALIVAFIACSKNHTETLDEEASLDVQSWVNDSTDDVGSGVTKISWIVVTDSIVATEIHKEETKTVTFPNDSIPNDCIPNDFTKII